VGDTSNIFRIGSIFFHTRFEFHDGGVDEKLLILMNTPERKEVYIFTTVTSQELIYSKKGPVAGNVRLKKKGCQPGPLEFFIPANDDFFYKDTWIQLYPPELNRANKEEVANAIFNTKVMQHKGFLSDNNIAELKNCIKKLKNDISTENFDSIIAGYKKWFSDN
jgi:hypothetical protein